MTVKLLIEHHFEFLSLHGGCTSSSESTHVKIPHCWKSQVTAYLSIQNLIPPLSVNIGVGTGTKIVSECGQEIPQSKTADNPKAPREEPQVRLTNESDYLCYVSLLINQLP